MKKLLFVSLFFLSPLTLAQDSCPRRTGVTSSLSCGDLYWRCPGDTGSGSRLGTAYGDNGVCPGNAVEFKVVYPSTCGGDDNQVCGTAYNTWTTNYSSCSCNTLKLATIDNSSCDTIGGGLREARIRLESCQPN